LQATNYSQRFSLSISSNAVIWCLFTFRQLISFILWYFMTYAIMTSLPFYFYLGNDVFAAVCAYVCAHKISIKCRGMSSCSAFRGSLYYNPERVVFNSFLIIYFDRVVHGPANKISIHRQEWNAPVLNRDVLSTKYFLVYLSLHLAMHTTLFESQLSWFFYFVLWNCVICIFIILCYSSEVNVIIIQTRFLMQC